MTRNLVNSADSEMVLITGANGHLGRKLLERLVDYRLRALVRSEVARRDLEELVKARNWTHVNIRQCDYLDASAMSEATQDCCYVVHLVGIIKESRSNSFHLAHSETTRVLKQALLQSNIKRTCYLSILGAASNSSNPCLASRAKAEQLLMEGQITPLILRIPMVLGEGDYASGALFRRASGVGPE